jgi:hypothetical protein
MGGFGRLLAAIGAGAAMTACAVASTTGPAAAMVRAGATAPAVHATPAAAPAAHAAEFGNPARPASVPLAGRAVSTLKPSRVIGHGSPAGCTSAAVVKAVAKGGVITFNCGPQPVTILMTATAKVVNTHHRTVLDGGGLVTLSGGNKVRILYMNTCDPRQKYTTDDCWEQQWPQLVVQNITLADAYSPVRQTSTSAYGGGAIFDEGGQLKVVNSGFIDDRCYAHGPDLGGAAIRALGMWQGSPVYITDDTFHGGRCSNGGALSSIDAKWDVVNSLFTDNKAIGFGQNPTQAGTLGGGSGGAIYTDGDAYQVVLNGTIIRYCHAREGGGAVFFVVDAHGGKLTIKNSTLHHNPSGVFQNAPGIFDEVDGSLKNPTEINSTVN